VNKREIRKALTGAAEELLSAGYFKPAEIVEQYRDANYASQAPVALHKWTRHYHRRRFENATIHASCENCGLMDGTAPKPNTNIYVRWYIWPDNERIQRAALRGRPVPKCEPSRQKVEA